MAVTINKSGIELDGTTVNWSGVFDIVSTSPTSFSLSYDIDTWLNSSGYTNAGHERYYMTIQVSGTGLTTQTKEVTVKAEATGWSGSSTHTVTGTLIFTTTTSSATTLNLRCTMRSSEDTSTSNYSTGTLALIDRTEEVVPPEPEIDLFEEHTTLTNKVSIDGNILLDLSEDTIRPEHVPAGITFHLANGFKTEGLQADYIVEAGDSGNWSYIKYASKRFVAWTYQTVSLTKDSSSGSIHYSTSTYLDLPSAITIDHSMSGCVYGLSSALHYVTNTGISSDSNRVYFRVCHPSALASSKDIHLEVTGWYV